MPGAGHRARQWRRPGGRVRGAWASPYWGFPRRSRQGRAAALGPADPSAHRAPGAGPAPAVQPLAPVRGDEVRGIMVLRVNAPRRRGWCGWKGRLRDGPSVPRMLQSPQSLETPE